ncbi:prenyltransferase/squalene oxidase repeat-containing protein [Streptomyces sp. NBC_00878]|uniref:prenyltransferase/squalene oxidase repeat-containing protein n=1 Tax=Streptomyces sp. NBC_00878 TaxID=2975854 RepID=UPI00225073AA|nr:prenyltransferase/squalene oxidase repeat-containing protein [Streptomyces sp. NBC_00878]MCX4909138.1 terpene cyclase/mutase family protein [Streptomyces sp. NBC_00878]
MFVRRSAAVLAATAVIGTAFTPAALADESPGATPSSSPSLAFPSALYGSTDPTYDGVWRQSLALLAQDTVGVKPAKQAVDWLVGQQCESGAFAAYRADPSAKCDAKTKVDTNSTGAALQALEALDASDAVMGAAVTWLKSVQNKDGGWGYFPGTPSDPNSTSVVIGALEAADTDVAGMKTKNGQTPYEALRAFTIVCDKGIGAFGFPDKEGALTENADATAAGVLGALGEGMVVEPGAKESPKEAQCVSGDFVTIKDAATGGAAYLAGAVAKNGYLKSVLPGAEDQPDHGTTADAVVALAATGRSADTAKPLAWLEKNSGTWAAKSGPAAYAQLIFAAHATGTDPRDFGGVDLVKELAATGPTGTSSNSSDYSSVPVDNKADSENAQDDGGVSLWWIIGVGLVGGIGVGFLISGRTKKDQQP